MKTGGETKRVLLISNSTVFGLREGAMVRVEHGATVLKGSSGARIFRKWREPVETLTGDKLDHLIFADHLGGD